MLVARLRAGSRGNGRAWRDKERGELKSEFDASSFRLLSGFLQASTLCFQLKLQLHFLMLKTFSFFSALHRRFIKKRGRSRPHLRHRRDRSLCSLPHLFVSVLNLFLLLPLHRIDVDAEMSLTLCSTSGSRKVNRWSNTRAGEKN